MRKENYALNVANTSLSA